MTFTPSGQATLISPWPRIHRHLGPLRGPAEARDPHQDPRDVCGRRRQADGGVLATGEAHLNCIIELGVTTTTRSPVVYLLSSCWTSPLSCAGQRSQVSAGRSCGEVGTYGAELTRLLLRAVAGDGADDVVDLLQAHWSASENAYRHGWDTPFRGHGQRHPRRTAAPGRPCTPVTRRRA